MRRINIVCNRYYVFIIYIHITYVFFEQLKFIKNLKPHGNYNKSINTLHENKRLHNRFLLCSYLSQMHIIFIAQRSKTYDGNCNELFSNRFE